MSSTPEAHADVSTCRYLFIVQLLTALTKLHDKELVHTALTSRNVRTYNRCLGQNQVPSRYQALKVDVHCVKPTLTWLYPGLASCGYHLAPEPFLSLHHGEIAFATPGMDMWAAGIILAETYIGSDLEKTFRGTMGQARLAALYRTRGFFTVVGLMCELAGASQKWLKVMLSCLHPEPQCRHGAADLLKVLLTHRWFTSERASIEDEAIFCNAAEMRIWVQPSFLMPFSHVLQTSITDTFFQPRGYSTCKHVSTPSITTSESSNMIASCCNEVFTISTETSLGRFGHEFDEPVPWISRPKSQSTNRTGLSREDSVPHH